MNDIINDTSSNKVSGTLLTAKRSLVCCFPCKIFDDDILFLKQVPVHPRDRLERKTKDEVRIVNRYLFILVKDLKENVPLITAVI